MFQTWLTDPKLNIEIQCLVKFGQEFYCPFTRFLVGYDPQFRITHSDSLKCLLPGRQAHQMPDFVTNSTSKLKNIQENIYSYFGAELLQSTEIMNDSEIDLLIKNLKCEIQKGIELHQK